VVARDFLITGLRLMASARGQILPAERLGKHKTSWQIITVVFFLVLLSARELKYAETGNGWWFRAWNNGGPLLVWIAVGFTLYSGLRYAWRHRDVIAPDQ
jgi:phosphatidylglycerophosphate synthase